MCPGAAPAKRATPGSTLLSCPASAGESLAQPAPVCVVGGDGKAARMLCNTWDDARSLLSSVVGAGGSQGNQQVKSVL